MRQLYSSACVVLLSLVVSLAPATAFGGKKKSAPPQATAKSSEQTKSETKDVTPSLDEVLAQPVQQQPLQGTVEHSGAVDAASGEPLQGKTDALGDDALKGSVTDSGAIGGIPLTPKQDKSPVLKGNASLLDGKLSEDPDLQDRELMIEWDRWRNRFLRAIQLQVQASINNPDDFDEPRPQPKVYYDPRRGRTIIQHQPRFPLGTEATFTVDVTPDKRIKNLAIVHSSGQPGYDRAVLEGIRALEGTSLLTYPAGSHRKVVNEVATIRASTSSDYQYQHFGDVERVRDQ